MDNETNIDRLIYPLPCNSPHYSVRWVQHPRRYNQIGLWVSWISRGTTNTNEDILHGRKTGCWVSERQQVLPTTYLDEE
jgi:hypothetical protein